VSVLIDIKCGDPNDAAARFQTAGYMDAYGKSAEALAFEPADHVYRLRATGEAVPSVTQILKATGVSLDFEALSASSPAIGRAVQVKRDIGIAVHADAHAFDDNDLVWATVNPEVRPYLEAWVAFREHYPFLRPATRERLVYHPGYRYAGTLDGIFLAKDEVAVEITERWSVQLTPENRVPYRVTAYDDHYGDLEVWRSIVTTYWHQHNRRAA
jgi:hypothetical protein